MRGSKQVLIAQPGIVRRNPGWQQKHCLSNVLDNYATETVYAISAVFFKPPIKRDKKHGNRQYRESKHQQCR